MSASANGGARSGIITLVGQFAKLSVQFLSITILSRILVPDDFGLIAMTAVFVSMGALLRDFGMPTAALQAQTLDNRQASNLFWINAVLAITGALLLVLFTPAIVALYGDERLAAVLPFMALTVVIGGLGGQHQIFLARRLRYTSLAMSEVGSQLIGFGVALACALGGLGFWALAWQAVATSLSLFAFQLIVSRWLPALPSRGAHTRPIIASGANFGAAQALTFAASNADTVLIGTRWGAEELGYYSRAFQLLSMPVQAMLTPLTNVVIPLVNRARLAGNSVDSMLVRIQFAVAATTVWVFMVAAATAPYLVPLLMGPGWGEAKLLFQILSLGGAVQVLSFVSYWGFMLYDRSRQLLYYNLVTKTLTVGAVLAGSFFSVEAVAWAYSLALIISWPINLVWLARSAGQNSWAYFRGGIRVLAAGALGVTVAIVASGYLPEATTELPALVAVGAVASVAYVLGLIVVPGGVGLVAGGARTVLTGLRRQG